jgi:predicted DsbA family dithiol-disulfide isomerase
MKVEIWADIYCPWCYIGKRRFERALEQFEHRDEVKVVWRSFQLDPHAPREPKAPAIEMLAQKYGVSLERARAMNRHVTTVAAQEGLEYHMDEVHRGNSFDAHRLVHLATTQGLADEMEERLFHAHFTEGQQVSDHETLIRLATEVGLGADEVRTMLGSDQFAAEVRADQQRAALLGSRGVPFYVFEERFGVSGAQPVELFQQALERTWEVMLEENERVAQ